MASTINERVETVITVLFRGNKRAFAQSVGISPTVVENIVGKRQGKPSFEVLEKICSNANISAEWLLLGTSDKLSDVFNFRKDLILSSKCKDDGDDVPEMITTFTTEKIPANLSAKRNDEITLISQNKQPGAIPLVSERAVGGFANEHFSIKESDILAYYVIPKFRYLGVDFMIELVGDSMIPRLFPGDIIACSIIHNANFIQWNKPHLIATREQGLIVKRLRKSPDSNCLLAVSDNIEYEPFDIPKDEILGLARIVGVIHLE